MTQLNYPAQGLPYFASLPYYLWGEINYDSDGDCNNPTDRAWSYLSVRNRINKSKHFSVAVSDDKKTMTIDGDDESTNLVKEFFSDTPNKDGMKRVDVVNYCFNHPNVQKFDQGHAFWGSWKWVGTMASEFTHVGRLLMMDAMRHSDTGAFVALQWYEEARQRRNQPVIKALHSHLVETCHMLDVEGGLVLEKVPDEPDADKWEAELLEFYKSILQKFDCLDDPLMIYENNENNDSSEESSEEENIDNLSNAWGFYGIDIFSETAITKFKDMGFPVIELDKELDKCTFNITGENHTVQASYKCPDCFPDNPSNSICQFCIKYCKEKNHNISQIKYVPGYCDKQMN